MGMLFGIFMIAIALVMLIKPNVFYEITEGWKNKGSSADLSNVYIYSTRFGGIMMMIFGVVAIILQIFIWCD